jgi:hypothetical protein
VTIPPFGPRPYLIFVKGCNCNNSLSNIYSYSGVQISANGTDKLLSPRQSTIRF